MSLGLGLLGILSELVIRAGRAPRRYIWVLTTAASLGSSALIMLPATGNALIAIVSSFHALAPTSPLLAASRVDARGADGPLIFYGLTSGTVFVFVASQIWRSHVALARACGQRRWDGRVDLWAGGPWHCWLL